MNAHRPLFMLLAGTALVAACGGEPKAPAGGAAPPPGAPAATAGPVSPDPGGQIIPVELTTDETGNYFSPKEIVAKRGDVIRFTLKLGVHSVHFSPDSNAHAAELPAGPSDLLQLPGQTYDVLVHMAPGRYYFQCDPHAALGMVGHLTVK